MGLKEAERKQSGPVTEEKDEDDTVNSPPSERHHVGHVTSIKRCSISLYVEDAASSNTVTSLYFTCLTVGTSSYSVDLENWV